MTDRVNPVAGDRVSLVTPVGVLCGHVERYAKGKLQVRTVLGLTSVKRTAEGIRWARGWRTNEAKALRASEALVDRGIVWDRGPSPRVVFPDAWTQARITRVERDALKALDPASVRMLVF